MISQSELSPSVHCLSRKNALYRGEKAAENCCASSDCDVCLGN
jgi:hypothetical protein